MRRYLTASLAISFFAVTAAGAQQKFKLGSTDIRPGGKIAAAQTFNGMDCTGTNVSPEMHWQGAPAKTKSYAFTMYDPDAPTGSGWWHWVVYNIPASATRLPTGAADPGKKLLPSGAVLGNVDVGTPTYTGPCPPKGDKAHRYIFTVYALDTDKLDVPASATAAYVGFNIHFHQLAKATFSAMYGR